MSKRDLLILAGTASEVLEGHGLVACGRRENGVTRVDFWTRHGKAYRHELADEETLTVDEIVATCLAMAAIHPLATRAISHLS
jgi:hypothetical protein